MQQDEIISIAGTIHQQLVSLTPINILLCWGISGGMAATEYNGMAALTFKVNARLFAGRVIIAYNDGADTYQVYLRDKAGDRLAREDVYFDELGGIIDEAIESGTDPEEYHRFCRDEFSRILQN